MLCPESGHMYVIVIHYRIKHTESIGEMIQDTRYQDYLGGCECEPQVYILMCNNIYTCSRSVSSFCDIIHLQCFIGAHGFVFLLMYMYICFEALCYVIIKPNSPTNLVYF